MTSRDSAATIAAFDFDGTLTDRDSVVPFVRGLAGTVRLGARMLAVPHRLAPAAIARDRDRIKELASRAAFRGRDVGEVEAAAERYGTRLLATRLRADTAERLRWHRDSGHTVVIVSASYELYLRAVARQLGVDGVLATRLLTAGGRFTGELDGANCRGPEKVRRLTAWLERRGLSRADTTLYAYGDSAGDRELLAVADHACWVNEPLASVAPAA